MSENPRAMYPPTLIDTAEALDRMLSRLIAEPVVAVDTESNSLYAYTERVCLVQFSIPGRDYLVDPLAVEDLSAMGALFGDPGIEKVFHAAEYDIMVLRRDYGFEFANLFDTMIASRIVGWARYGLGSLLKRHFGVVTDKRMQRTNWGRRPLSAEQLEYARLDTHYLLPLREKLLSALIAQNRLEEGRVSFSQVAQSQWTDREFDPDGFWRIKDAGDLDGVGLGVLRALYLYRDRRAQDLDRPPFKVLSDRVLVALSQQCPRSLAELGRIKGVPRQLSNRNRRKILAVIERGLQDGAPPRPERARRARPDEPTLVRYEALRRWRKERAEARGVESDVILPNRALHVLARENPTSPEGLRMSAALNDWERQAYGKEILALLRQELERKRPNDRPRRIDD